MRSNTELETRFIALLSERNFLPPALVGMDQFEDRFEGAVRFRTLHGPNVGTEAMMDVTQTLQAVRDRGRSQGILEMYHGIKQAVCGRLGNLPTGTIVVDVDSGTLNSFLRNPVHLTATFATTVAGDSPEGPWFAVPIRPAHEKRSASVAMVTFKAHDLDIQLFNQFGLPKNPASPVIEANVPRLLGRFSAPPGKLPDLERATRGSAWRRWRLTRAFLSEINPTLPEPIAARLRSRSGKVRFLGMAEGVSPEVRRWTSRRSRVPRLPALYSSRPTRSRSRSVPRWND